MIVAPSILKMETSMKDDMSLEVIQEYADKVEHQLFEVQWYGLAKDCSFCTHCKRILEALTFQYYCELALTEAGVPITPDTMEAAMVEPDHVCERFEQG